MNEGTLLAWIILLLPVAGALFVVFGFRADRKPVPPPVYGQTVKPTQYGNPPRVSPGLNKPPGWNHHVLYPETLPDKYNLSVKEATVTVTVPLAHWKQCEYCQAHYQLRIND